MISDDRLDEVVDALARHLSGGGQAYWVCPLVEESEKTDLAAAEARAAALAQRFGDKVGLIHGRMKGPEKDAVMSPLLSRPDRRAGRDDGDRGGRGRAQCPR